MKLVIALIAMLTMGCATKLTLSEITDAPVGSQIGGIPFRVKAPHTLRVYQRTAEGKYEPIKVFYEEFADTTRLYALNYDSDVFANHAFDVDLNADGTLSKVELKGDAQTPQAIDALTESVKATAGAVADAKKLEQDLRKAEEEARKKAKAADADLATKRLAAVAAFNEAEAASDELAALPDTTPAAEVAALKRQVEYLQLRANQLYLEAGMMPPYDVSFPE